MTSRPITYSRICPNCKERFPKDCTQCPVDHTPLLVVDRTANFLDETLRYQVTDTISVGGWGTVYLAHDPQLGRNVAVKVLHGHLAGNEQKIQRFQLEARTVSKISHPNVAPLYDYGLTAEGLPYFVMEHVPGKTLTEHLSEGPPDLEFAFAVAQQLCDGMSAAHAQGVVHRDITPNNIIIGGTKESPHAKIVDFGICKLIAEESDDINHLTRTGETIGTPAYMSPEQCLGKTIDYRSDIYSAGLVIYEMLTGRKVVDSPVLLDCMNRHVSSNPLKLKEVCPAADFPPGLEHVIFKSLAKNPVDRYQSAREFKADLLGVAEGSFRPVRKIPSDKLGQFAAAAIGLIIIAVASIGIGQYFAGQTASNKAVPREKASLSSVAPQRLETAQDVENYVASFFSTQPLASELDLQNLPVTDQTLALVPQFKLLRDLKLQRTKVTAAGLSKLSGMQLEELEIDQTPIGNAGAGAIAKISSLREVLASGTGLSDEGVAKLSALSNLEKLEIRDNPEITDQSVKALARLTELEVLRISRTGITDNGVKELQLALPNCVISSGGGPRVEED